MSATAKPGITLAADETAAGHGVSFADAFKVWLRVALLSFGGPA
jgi:chromate transporter